VSISARAVSCARNEWGSWGSDREWSHEELRWADLKDEEKFTPGSALPDVKFAVSPGGAAAQQQQQQQGTQQQFGVHVLAMDQVRMLQ
jgi:hypothetical protein